jgi:hypothetical protein
MMKIGDRGPCLAIYSPGGKVTSRFGKESTSRTRLEVLYMLTVNFRQPKVLVIHWFRL